MKGYKVLVVEDQVDVRRVLRSGLESLGANLHVLALPSGEEALLISAYQPFDLLVSDVRLAGISGLELVEKIRVLHPQIKVILVTGMTDPEIRQRVSQVGAEAYFFKPIPMSDFLDKVVRILGISGEKETPPSEEREPQGELEPSEEAMNEMARLLQETGAVSILLVDHEGKILAEVGETPGEINVPELLPPVLRLSTEVQKLLSSSAGRMQKGLLHIAGTSFDTWYIHMGNTRFVLILVCSGIAKLEYGAIYERILSVGAGFEVQLEGNLIHEDAQTVELGTLAPAKETEPDEKTRSELDLIFHQAEEEKSSEADADAFWDSAVEDNGLYIYDSQGRLTFEEARRLGLAPEEGKE